MNIQMLFRVLIQKRTNSKLNLILQRTVWTLDVEQHKLVTPTHMKEVLMRNGLQYEEGHTCLKTICPINSSQAHSSFVNKISGYFTCHSCKMAGDWESLEEYLSNPHNDSKTILCSKSIVEGEKQWNRIKKHLKPIMKVTKEDLIEVLTALDFEERDVELLDSLEAHVDIENKEICVPLKNDYSIAGYKSITKQGEEAFPGLNASGLVRTTDNGERVVIVQNLKDLLSLHPLRKDWDIACLPYGQNSLPQEVLPLLEDYLNVTLWFHNDIIAWENIRSFAKKLGDKRCSFIRPNADNLSPSLAKRKGMSLHKMLADAEAISHSSIATFADIREDVKSEVFNIDKLSGVKWSRFDFLNPLLKGHRRGELTVVTGPTGIGKTTFISEYSVDLAVNGVTTLWGSFEIRNQRLARMMLHQYAREPLDRMELFNHWADRFERLPIYFMTYHGQQTLELVMNAVDHATYVHDIAHVVIDNVQFMLGLSSTEAGYLDRFYRQDALIAAFRNFATSRNVHVTLVIHPRKEREGEMLTASSIFGGAKASQEADNVLIIQQRTLQNLKRKTFIQVAKNRYSGDLGVCYLEFDKNSLSFVPRIPSKTSSVD